MVLSFLDYLAGIFGFVEGGEEGVGVAYCSIDFGEVEGMGVGEK